MTDILICLLLALVCMTALADVAINKTNFPDANFREYVEWFDTDESRPFGDAELDEVTKISYPEYNYGEDQKLTSVKGLKHFYIVTVGCFV